ncbi:unnamed protein product, partial [Strongylus vulgaris]
MVLVVLKQYLKEQISRMIPAPPSHNSIAKTSVASQDQAKTTVVSIKGMTCHACVNNIQDTIGTRPGIRSCTVSLEAAEGVVVFDPSLWTAEKVAESIDDMGFEAKVKDIPKDITIADAKVPLHANSTQRKAVISIKGMVCHACVNNIQDTVSQRPGVHSVVVSLEKEEGVFTFDPSILTDDQIVEAVDDMGFEAKLVSAEDVSQTIEVKGSAAPAKDFLTIEVKGSAAPAKDFLVRFSKPDKVELSPKKSKIHPETAVENLEKCTLAVEGMTCASCVQYIERNIAKLKVLTNIGGLNSEADANRIESHAISKTGVESCHVSLATSIATVEFSPSAVGPRDLIALIEVYIFGGCYTHLHSRSAIWRTTFFVSLIFGIPVMLIMVVFHWILHTPMHPENQTPILSPALSLDNLLLLLLCTPVQVIGGRYFYVASWKALRHGTANMDVLIVLATTIAFTYSILVLIIAIVLRWPSSPMTFFDVPPMLIVFISLGRMLEHKAKGKTSEALSRLMSLQAKEATL